MKKIILALVVSVFTFSCKDNAVNPTVQKLALNNWKLDRYTDLTGKTISESSLGTDAKYLLKDMSFQFKDNFETRAINNADGTIINRGTWSLNADNSVITVKVIAFDGDFKIVTLNTGTLTLQTSKKEFLAGQTINMEFSAK